MKIAAFQKVPRPAMLIEYYSRCSLNVVCQGCDSVKGYLKSVELKCRVFAEVLRANSDECGEACFSFVEMLLSLLICIIVIIT